MLELRRLFALVCLWATTVLAFSATGQRVLVVYEPKVKKEEYSTFFGGLEKRGYSLTFREVKSTSPQVVQEGVNAFDHLIFFTPTTKTFTADLAPQSIINLISRGVNVPIALSPSQTPLHSLAAEFGLILPPPQTPLVDHFSNYESDPWKLVIPLQKESNFLPMSRGGKLVYKGISMAYTPNPSLFPFLSAPVESYATDNDGSTDKGADAIAQSVEKGGEGLWAGSTMGIVSGFVASNGARIAFSGGIELFSDEFCGYKIHGARSSNAVFIQDLSAWNFQENMVLRVRQVSHYLASEKNESSKVNPKPKEQYTINDRITYAIELQQFSARDGKYYPFKLPATITYSHETGDPIIQHTDSLQMAFTMLDPHVRVTLSPIPGSPGTFGTTFRAPDRHGVFKFHFVYKRTGWTPLESEVTVPLVPPRHDGYPRFLSSAWPYYAGAVSTSAGFVLFCAVWLGSYGADEEGKGKSAKSE